MSRSVSKTITRRKIGRSPKELKNLKLGQVTTDYPSTYSPALLESFPNRHPKSEAWTSLLCPEFTSLCPKTGQPDFAHITINYVADKKMVESKSLKLYLFSFRNHGDFHEDCIQTICNDLVKLMSPKYLEVIGEFTPRGGISIFPFASYACDDPEFQNLKAHRFYNYAPQQ
ncbi:MAG: 7-cyano-7-deazaguanine reductase [Bdellovibrionales bacterium GWA2_49_15]|nr:MAG: 7-cyano-7-deazaguanine reductase [Bdellovibrionales bacterium GWA2_49_15]HAZ12641.1 7-cyano-7-deazaguanine reductase [Bdellovibrionales bacterium]